MTSETRQFLTRALKNALQVTHELLVHRIVGRFEGFKRPLGGRDQDSEQGYFLSLRPHMDVSTALRGERNGPRSGECRGEAGEHHEVGVESDPLKPANAERGKAVLVLQATELPLDGGAAR